MSQVKDFKDSSDEFKHVGSKRVSTSPIADERNTTKKPKTSSGQPQSLPSSSTQSLSSSSTQSPPTSSSIQAPPTSLSIQPPLNPNDTSKQTGAVVAVNQVSAQSGWQWSNLIKETPTKKEKEAAKIRDSIRQNDNDFCRSIQNGIGRDPVHAILSMCHGWLGPTNIELAKAISEHKDNIKMDEKVRDDTNFWKTADDFTGDKRFILNAFIVHQ